MATANDIVNVQITRATQFPSRPGFSVPLFMALHTYWTDLARRVSSLQELIDAGAETHDPAYRMCNAAFSQNPRPTAVILGRRTRAYTQVVKLSPLVTTEGFVYDFDVVQPDGEVIPITYTVLAAATTTSVGTAIAALIDAAADITAASVSGVITSTTTAGKLARYKRLPPIAVMTVEVTSADPGADDDLTDVETAQQLDPTLSSFGIAFDHDSAASIATVVEWVESRQQIFAAVCNDSEITDSGVTDDVGSTHQDAAITRTFVMLAQRDTADYRQCGLLGAMLPEDPGSNTWAHKTIAGISPDVLTDGQAATAEGKNVMTYRPYAAGNKTYAGKVASGEWIDVMVGLTAMYALIQSNTLTLIQNAPKKIPFTDKGIETITQNGVGATLNGFVTTGFLTNDPAPTVTAPKAKNIPSEEKAARQLKGITFTCYVSGAIHTVQIRGTLSV